MQVPVVDGTQEIWHTVEAYIADTSHSGIEILVGAVRSDCCSEGKLHGLSSLISLWR